MPLGTLSVRRTIDRTFIVGITIVVSMGTAAIVSLRQLAGAAAERKQHNDIQHAYTLLLGVLSDAETSGRGYLLTSDTSFLAPLRASRARLPGILDELGALLSFGDHADSRVASRLDSMARLKLSELDSTIVLQRGGEPAAALRRVRMNAGGGVMEGMRSLVDSLDAASEMQVAASHSRVVRYQRMTTIAMLVFVALSAGIMLTVRSLIHREVAERGRVRKALAESEQLRDSLVHMIVHDLRSPLTALRMNLEILESDVAGLDPEIRESVAGARDAAYNMSRMIGDVLDVSRLEAGAMPVTRVATDLCELAAEAVESLQPIAREKVLLSQTCSQYLEVRCDPAVMERVIVNLVANAIKFTPEGGRIEVAVTPQGANARLTVQDTGPGIKAEFRQQIFEKFGQVDARKQGAQSTGLGLTFCKLAVEAHGGTIGVDFADAESGSGSRFWVEIPIAAE